MKSDRELDYLRQLFQSEIRRIDGILAEREKETQASLNESLRAREAANEWRGAMRDRENDYVPVAAHDRLQEQVDRVIAQQQKSIGRSTAWVAAAGIIATLLAIGVGQIIRQGITSGDVSQQIQREAPWNRDKDSVTRRLALLEQQVQRQQITITMLQGDLRAHEIEDGNRDGVK